MKDTDKKFCAILLDVLAEKGVKDIVCSPGSRNAPLLIGVASRSEFKKHFIVDERAAAFYGLGLSLVSKRPVVLICTSGSALLNYSPAIAEAFYRGTPLIVISADRPEQWIDQDDSQTIRQNYALDNFVKKSYSIPAYGEEEKQMGWFVNRIANDAFITCSSGKQGPVHLNISFAEPLGNKVQRKYKVERLIDIIQGDAIGNREIIRELAAEFCQSKVLLAAGFMAPDALLQKAVTSIAKFPNVTVMAETISNLHLNSEDYSIDSTLTGLTAEQLESLRPNLIISIGGALVSRKLKEYLRSNQIKATHWSVGYQHTTVDPFMSLSLRIETEPSRFFRNLAKMAIKKNIDKNVINYKKEWDEVKKISLKAKKEFIEKAPWSELAALNHILKSLPPGVNLFLSNGTPIRYSQILSDSIPHAVYCNRGVSGIDGTLSTTIGGAVEYKGQTILLTGDLSLAYDMGALGIKHIPERLKIILIDNGGGGIFRFIPSTSDLEEREEYFCMPPILPIKDLASAYGWKYFEASDFRSLSLSFPDFLSSGKKSVMRVVCDGQISASVLLDYMKVKAK